MPRYSDLGWTQVLDVDATSAVNNSSKFGEAGQLLLGAFWTFTDLGPNISSIVLEAEDPDSPDSFISFTDSEGADIRFTGEAVNASTSRFYYPGTLEKVALTGVILPGPLRAVLTFSGTGTSTLALWVKLLESF